MEKKTDEKYKDSHFEKLAYSNRPVEKLENVV